MDLEQKDYGLRLPILTKNNIPIKWWESFKHYLHNTFGVCKVPLSYIIHPEVGVTPEVDYPLEAGKAHGSSRSILQDLINCSSHTHPLYSIDNSTVYSLIEQAAQSSNYLTLEGSFSSLSTATSARKDAFCSIFQTIHKI